jgi:hypothetical protein
MSLRVSHLSPAPVLDLRESHADSLRMFIMTSSNIIGAIVLVAIVQPWFLLAVAVVLVFYLYAAAFYRSSARELKVRL